jgi:hypothetical protein
MKSWLARRGVQPVHRFRMKRAAVLFKAMVTIRDSLFCENSDIDISGPWFDAFWLHAVIALD